MYLISQRGTTVTTLLVFVLFLTSIGCVTSTGKTLPEQTAPITTKEGIVILAYREFAIETSAFTKNEEELVDCLRTPIKRAHPHLRIVPADEFRRIAFPDLAAEKTPTRPDSLALLLDHSVFQERVARLDLRYIIVVGALTTQSPPQQWGGCSFVPGAGGCVVFFVWNQESHMAASILDVHQTAKLSEFSETVTGKASLSIPLVPLLPIPAPTESKACSDLGETIATYLSPGQSSAP